MKLSKNALIAAAVTGMLPIDASAAALNQNLAVDPSFESTPVGWSGNVSTYAYSQGYTGPAPANAGLRYWNGGGGDPLATQLIDLNGNSAQIDVGGIGYNMSAFFSTYQGQLDYGTVRAVFLDSSSAQLGSASVGGAAFVGALGGGTGPRAWGQDAISGSIPTGTRSVRLALDGEKQPNVGAAADGYIDLVNFQISQVPEPGTVTLMGMGLLAGCFYLRRRR